MATVSNGASTADRDCSEECCKHTVVDLNPSHTARVISCLCACHFPPLAHSSHRDGEPSDCPETTKGSLKQSTSTASKDQRSGSGEKRVTFWEKLQIISLQIYKLNLSIYIYIVNTCKIQSNQHFYESLRGERKSVGLIMLCFVCKSFT